MMILYMVIPRKINFTQMGRYCDSCEQRSRQLYEHGFDWLGFNMSLMTRGLSRGKRKAIAIDASYISKAAKKTPYIGKSWSGCASAIKRGLEILGIGIIDVDRHDCMMLRTEPLPGKGLAETRFRFQRINGDGERCQDYAEEILSETLHRTTKVLYEQHLHTQKNFSKIQSETEQKF